MLNKEFDRQVENLINKGYPALIGLEAEGFKKRLEPLRAVIDASNTLEESEERIPFVIVIKGDWVNGELAMGLVERNNKKGFSVMEAEEVERFKPIEGIQLPNGMAYLVLDIDTGESTRNITPNDSIKIIINENRSPLTLEEGVAVITHYPDMLMKNKGFSLLGSRCGDKRVTALWISEGKPKLGWCWAGNPHTWLGSASCASRAGI
ncbi:DUF5701 family protein [Paenibacillus sp. EC2-1]|uniref:DUF5701 family protein n=1 Tax=Paenibacillus sp. EC2-1 TaxID=3388665 RepID=UPI003BEF4700